MKTKIKIYIIYFIFLVLFSFALFFQSIIYKYAEWFNLI